MNVVTNLKKPLIVIAAVIAMGAAGIVAIPAVSAQGNPPAPAGNVRAGLLAVQLCSTTDYTAVAAKALGISTGDLHLALTAGQSLQEVAKSKNVDMKTITDAVSAARKAELDQAVKDGLLTQQEADALASGRPMMGMGFGMGPGGPNRRGNMPNQPNQPNQPATPDAQSADGTATQQAPAPGQGRMNPGTILRGIFQGMFMRGRGLAGISPRNEVRNAVVAADALGMKCADLIKTSLTNRESLAQIAHDQKVDVQKVIDALVKAHKDALALDVKEGLVTQALVDARSADLQKNIENFVYNPMSLLAGLGRGFGPGR